MKFNLIEAYIIVTHYYTHFKNYLLGYYKIITKQQGIETRVLKRHKHNPSIWQSSNWVYYSNLRQHRTKIMETKDKSGYLSFIILIILILLYFGISPIFLF